MQLLCICIYKYIFICIELFEHNCLFVLFLPVLHSVCFPSFPFFYTDFYSINRWPYMVFTLLFVYTFFTWHFYKFYKIGQYRLEGLKSVLKCIIIIFIITITSIITVAISLSHNITRSHVNNTKVMYGQQKR